MKAKQSRTIKHATAKKVEIIQQIPVRVKSVARLRHNVWQPMLSNTLFAKQLEGSVPIVDETPKSAAPQLGDIAPLTSAVRATKVDRSRRSWLHERYDIMRGDGVKLSVTPQFMALFYDLTVPQAIDVLGIPMRTMRRLRVWCGLSRWPRQIVLDNKHPVLTVDAVRKERRNIMQWALDNRDAMLYGMLYKAHQLAGCAMQGVPLASACASRDAWRFPDSVAPGEELPLATAAEEPAPAAEEPVPAAEAPVLAAEEPAPAAVEPVLATEEPVPAAEDPSSVQEAVEIDWDALFDGTGPAEAPPGIADEDDEWRRFFAGDEMA
jgi:hypothetical protein